MQELNTRAHVISSIAHTDLTAVIMLRCALLFLRPAADRGLHGKARPTSAFTRLGHRGVPSHRVSVVSQCKMSIVSVSHMVELSARVLAGLSSLGNERWARCD